MSVTIDDLLRDFGAGIGPDEFAAAVYAEMAATSRPGSSALTEPERRALVGGGIPPDVLTDPQTSTVLHREARQALHLADRSVDVATVAAALGIDPSRVRHRIHDKALYAVKLGRILRLPLWQFDDSGQPLPGLRTVLAALPADTHPRSLEGLMTGQQGELFIGGKPRTPREWLAAGRDPAAVAALVADQQW